MSAAAARFADREERVRAVRRQKIVQGNGAIAEELVDAGELVTFHPDAELMRQHDRDDGCWFLLAGEVELHVNGDVLPYRRVAGEVVGEFSAINPAMARSATVVAVGEVAALKCPSAALKAVCNKEPELWEALAIELTLKIEQRNRLIATVNARPRVFMIAADERMVVAQALRTMLSRDYDVDLWSDDDVAPPIDYELEALRARAREADFGIVFAHERDLLDDGGPVAEGFRTVKFELGYVMSELTRHRTVLVVPCGEQPPRLFKGLQPMTYELPSRGMPLTVALAKVAEDVGVIIEDRKVRSRLREPA